ncbi:MAG: FAD:protein FMN transferase [Aeromicrobium sp.]
MGTRWSIDTARPLSADDQAAVAALIAADDHRWSRFCDDGLVARLSSGEPVDLGDGATELLDLYDRLHAVTDGAVNPLVGADLERLGYDPSYSLTPTGEPQGAPDWRAVQRDGSTLRLPPGAVLDVGAAGKGHLVDRVAALLRERGHAPTVDAGGDIAHHGPAPIRVALEHPGDPRLAVGVVDLAPGQALCGSSVNRRAWGDGLHHVLDARTGQPVRSVVATWATAGSAALADGCATALFHVRPEKLAGWGMEAAWIDRTGLHTTPDLPAEVFS